VDLNILRRALSTSPEIPLSQLASGPFAAQQWHGILVRENSRHKVHITVYSVAKKVGEAIKSVDLFLLSLTLGHTLDCDGTILLAGYF
jgi:hypothetical protein